MWPVFYAFGQRFSRLLVLPIAAIVGTIGYYAERKFFPNQKSIPYLEKSVQEQREQRLAQGSFGSTSNELPNSLGVLQPNRSDI